MLLKYDTVVKIGIWGDRITSQPWELTIRIVDWWGLRERIVKQVVDIPFSVNEYEFYEPRLNKWFTTAKQFKDNK